MLSEMKSYDTFEYRALIDEGTDDQIILTGYRYSRLRYILFFIVTFGLGFLLLKWYPHWLTNLAGTICPISSADFLLIKLDHPFAAQAIRRSRRIQGLNPLEYSKMQHEGRETPQGEYHFKHIRNPSIFSGEPGQSSEKWLKEYHRVARYNCWDSSMCLANVYFFLSGTAKVWFENVEEKITSWELFETMLSQAFGHYSSEKDQLLEKLKARAQGKEESSEAYIQDVLYLCRQINPNMNENEKVAHLVKGVSEEIYRAIVTFEIATTEEFIRWCRKIELSQKKRVNTRIVFDRLPNAAAINPAESESMEDLIRRIVREEIHHALNPEPATLKPSSLDLIIREEVERNLSAISQPVQRPMPRQQSPLSKPVALSWPWKIPLKTKRNAVALSPIQSISSPPKPGKLRRATETGGKAADESINPPPIITANMKRNYVVIIINGQNVEALVDSGADYSVISENFRRYLKIPFFAEKGPVLRVANRKHIETLGRCNLKVSIEELEIYFTFVVFSECSHHIILGLDFFRATSAVIDCGKGEIHLKESVNDGLEEDLPTHALEDCFIPARSIKKITVINEDIRGGKDLMIEGSKDLILKKELVIPSSIINFHHGRGEIWVTNGTSQNQIIPAGMLVGNLRKIGSSGIYSVDTAEDDKTQSNIKSEDRRQQILSLVDERLDKEQKSMIVECLEKYSEVFDFERKSFSTTSNVKHKIDTSDSRPIKQRPYRVSPVERRAIQSEVDKMIKMGIVQPSESPWSSPVVLVKKKDGSWRFCVDYRKLNKVTKKDVYPLPRNDDVLDSLTGAKFFSSMDLRTGYWQIEIDEEDREKTAFITPDGLYEFRVMPFGLCNAPATFERMMDKLLAGLKWTICLCYLDDIIVYATSFKEHIERLGKVLRCIQQAGLCINHEKCRFGSREIKVLGHLVTESGIRPDPDKIEAITNFPTPKTAHEVRSFMGLCSYYRRFVKDFANKAKPLHDLLRNNVKFFWSNEQEQSFQILKSALTTDPVLGHFKEDAETLVHTDASGYGVGAVLTQLVEGKEKPIAYASRTLNAAERNYSTTERECLAVVWAIYKFRPYLFGKHFTVVSDHHSLCWLANVKDPSGRLARWALRLQEFDISIVYKNGKRHQDADCLSRSPLPQSNEDNIPELSSITDIGKEQRSDVQTKKIIQEIDSKSESGYKIIDGILYRKNYDPMGKPWLLVVPKQMRVDILSEAHDAPMAGHLGFAKTYDRIRRKYFWPGLHRSVRQYVAHCRECQRRKGSTERPPGQLVPIPPVARPFQKIGIDLLGRFPTSNDGNKWTVVATDYLTRYAMTKAIPNGSSEEVGKFLVEDVILKHGAPRELISDRGRTFISHTIREINNLCGTAHRFTSAYHPQTNGLTERLNKTLGDMLSMYVDVDQRNWDSVLPYVTFAYNTAKQETTGFSPFYLVHGRDVETPLDTILTYREEANLEDYVESLVTNAEDARQLARLNILKAQEKDKSRYNKSHRPVQYRAEDLVWVYTPVRKQGLSEKLLKRYFGPYKVVRQLSEVTYEVEALERRPRQRNIKDIVHVLRMKPYRSPEEQTQD
ncbi:K02A2.6-like [Cordylochernes scorpioides]|uniref:Cation-transporting ATPase n=1 Tax=Cordylochernes scorpioides TaxID=51811 RepID=A0ABY6K918_9ARAC|nr:K02A2.6-like [Cordylochernes scorpioides]